MITQATSVDAILFGSQPLAEKFAAVFEAVQIIWLNITPALSQVCWARLSWNAD